MKDEAYVCEGASNINQGSTYDSLLQAPCTSCEIQDDKSAYWSPLLYYQHPNGKFEEVPNGGMTVYYEGRGNDRNLQPFPPGFRMVSGVTGARSYNSQDLIPGSSRPKSDRVSFACLDGHPNMEQPSMVDTDCKDGLRAQVHFQSCWNGKDLYKEDNSHVEYMSGLDNGVCPPTHPVPLIHMFFEVLYSVNSVNKDGGKFVFSQGDTTGFGFHGDFLNGWKTDVLTAGIQQCAFTSTGGVGDCAPFKPSNNPKFSDICPEQPSLLNEPVHGTIDKLPGCITITSGPQDATAADMNCADSGTSNKLPLNPVSNLTAPATTLISKVASDTAAATVKPSAKAHRRSIDEAPRVAARNVPVDGEYGYDFDWPTPTGHGPPIVYGSPAPHHGHHQRNRRSRAVVNDA
ncbi:MAG: hypothetical protein Q9222_004116 [Ikaeria aurantiellina]